MNVNNVAIFMNQQ